MRYAWIWFFLFSLSKIGSAAESVVQVKKHQLLRIGGDFKISNIEHRGTKGFRVLFRSSVAGDKYDRLVLNSDHLHMGIQEGRTLRISAEVVQVSADLLEISQVLIFLPIANYGLTPIWMLSNNYPTDEFRGAKWLDMHAPQSDFEIM